MGERKPSERLTAAWRPRFIREHDGFMVYIGPWAARFSWSRRGYFVNGSRWFSGWSRWTDEPEF